MITNDHICNVVVVFIICSYEMFISHLRRLKCASKNVSATKQHGPFVISCQSHGGYSSLFGCPNNGHHGQQSHGVNVDFPFGTKHPDESHDSPLLIWLIFRGY